MKLKKEKYFNYTALICSDSSCSYIDLESSPTYFDAIENYFKGLKTTKSVEIITVFLYDEYRGTQSISEVTIHIESKLSLDEILSEVVHCKNELDIDLKTMYETLNLDRYYTKKGRYGSNFDSIDFMRYLMYVTFFLILIQVSVSYLGKYTNTTESESVVEKNKAFSHYIHDDINNTKVIIFVHGVTGNAVSTWTNEKTNAYWPELMRTDKDFSKANIYVFEYPSPPIGKSLSINELAEKMRMRLEADGIFKHSKIIFLSHSMGGLITRDFLQKYRNIAKKVDFAYFYATPTEGSPYASLADIISSNPQMKNLYPMQSDNYLGDLKRNWIAAKLNIKSYCAYEGSGVYGVTIVSYSSATALCNQALDPMIENHIDIVKPKDKKSDIYNSFKNAYLQNNTL